MFPHNRASPRTTKLQNMKTKHLVKKLVLGKFLGPALAAIATCFAPVAQAVLISIPDDAAIQSNTPDTNYGSAASIYSYYRNITGQPYYKSWIKLDATSLPTLTSGNTTLSLTASNANAGYTIDFYLLSGVDSSTWAENTITWNNAPGNNTGGAGFTGGANATLIGSFTTFTFVLNTTYGLSITGAGETALLSALNTGSRTATIAFQRTGSGTLVNNFHSTEATTSSYRPTLDAIPEPSTFALLGVGLAAVACFRRRK